MTPNRYDAKTDANQAEIVEALRAVGATVLVLSRVGQGCPDLAVGYHKKNYFMEVKNLEGRGDALTAEELEFFNVWRGQTAIVRTVDEALALIGAVDYNVTDQADKGIDTDSPFAGGTIWVDFDGEGTA